MTSLSLNPLDDEERPYGGMKFYISEEDRIILRELVQKLDDALATATFKDAAEKLVDSFERNNSLLSRMIEVIESLHPSNIETIASGIAAVKKQLENIDKSIAGSETDSRLDEISNMLQESSAILERNLEILSKKDSATLSEIIGLKDTAEGLKEALSRNDNVSYEFDELKEKIMELKEMLSERDKNSQTDFSEINNLVQKIDILSQRNGILSSGITELKDMISQKDSEDIARFESISEAMNNIHKEVESEKSDMAALYDKIKDLRLEPVSEKDTKILESIKSDVFSLYDEIKNLKETVAEAKAKPVHASVKGLKTALKKIDELKASLEGVNSTVGAINALNSYLYSAYDINNLLLAMQTSASRMPEWAERKQKQLMSSIRSTLDELVDISIIKSLNESEKNIAQLTADVPADDELVKNRLDVLIKADKVSVIKEGDRIRYGVVE